MEVQGLDSIQAQHIQWQKAVALEAYAIAGTAILDRSRQKPSDNGAKVCSRMLCHQSVNQWSELTAIGYCLSYQEGPVLIWDSFR